VDPALHLDCLSCGACCREAYHAVEVGPRDPVRRFQPGWLVQRDGRWQVRRVPVPGSPIPGANRCACLGDDYRCAIYDERPRTCRDFTPYSRNCREARLRVGLEA
jgi:Fe-S-cluster containining protein